MGATRCRHFERVSCTSVACRRQRLQETESTPIAPWECPLMITARQVASGMRYRCPFGQGRVRPHCDGGETSASSIGGVETGCEQDCHRQSSGAALHARPVTCAARTHHNRHRRRRRQTIGAPSHTGNCCIRRSPTSAGTCSLLPCSNLTTSRQRAGSSDFVVNKKSARNATHKSCTTTSGATGPR